MSSPSFFRLSALGGPSRFTAALPVLVALSAGSIFGAPGHPNPPANGGPKAKMTEKAGAAKAKLASREKPAPTPEQQANLDQLKSDLTSIKAGSTVTPEQKQQLAASLQACATGATKPSQESTAALANSLSTAMADRNVSSTEKVQIAGAVQAVLASAGVSSAEIESVVTSAQAILQSSGVTQATVALVVNDLKVIATEAKANAPAPR